MKRVVNPKINQGGCKGMKWYAKRRLGHEKVMKIHPRECKGMQRNGNHKINQGGCKGIKTASKGVTRACKGMQGVNWSLLVEIRLLKSESFYNLSNQGHKLCKLTQVGLQTS